MPRTRVVCLIAAHDLSGPVKGLLQLMHGYNAHEYEIQICSFQYRRAKKNAMLTCLARQRITVCLLIHNHSRSYMSLARQLIGMIRKNRIDVLQTHGFKPTFLAFVAKLFCRVKWICFMHGATTENLKVRLYNLADSILQRAADRTVLVSEAQRSKILGGRDRRRVVVLHNAVDLDNPMPISRGAPPLRRRLNLRDSDQVVITVGRFSPEKGMDVLLDAFALLARRIENAHLVLVGDGQERPKLEAQAGSFRLNGRVHFVGSCETPGDYVADADVFVLPSRSEGIPNAVLEAMAMGKPVVATAVGGVPEIITDGVSGRLVPAERPDLLAEGLAEVLTDRELYQQFAIEGKRRVREAFSVQARVGKLQDLYREVLQRSH